MWYHIIMNKNNSYPFPSEQSMIWFSSFNGFNYVDSENEKITEKITEIPEPREVRIPRSDDPKKDPIIQNPEAKNDDPVYFPYRKIYNFTVENSQLDKEIYSNVSNLFSDFFGSLKKKITVINSVPESHVLTQLNSGSESRVLTQETKSNPILLPNPSLHVAPDQLNTNKFMFHIKKYSSEPLYAIIMAAGGIFILNKLFNETLINLIGLGYPLYVHHNECMTRPDVDASEKEKMNNTFVMYVIIYIHLNTLCHLTQNISQIVPFYYPLRVLIYGILIYSIKKNPQLIYLLYRKLILFDSYVYSTGSDAFKELIKFLV